MKMLNFVLYLYQLLFEDHKIIDLSGEISGVMELWKGTKSFHRTKFKKMNCESRTQNEIDVSGRKQKCIMNGFREIYST